MEVILLYCLKDWRVFTHMAERDTQPGQGAGWKTQNVDENPGLDRISRFADLRTLAKENYITNHTIFRTRHCNHTLPSSCTCLPCLCHRCITQGLVNYNGLKTRIPFWIWSSAWDKTLDTVGSEKPVLAVEYACWYALVREHLNVSQTSTERRTATPVDLNLLGFVLVRSRRLVAF